MKKGIAMLVAVVFSGLSAQAVWADTDAEKLFKDKCSVCHKMEKKGMGPAVTTMNPDATVLKSAISDGRKSMPAFAEKLGEERINALIAFIQSKQPGFSPCAENLSGK